LDVSHCEYRSILFDVFFDISKDVLGSHIIVLRAAST